MFLYTVFIYLSMDNLIRNTISKFQDYRSKRLKRLAVFLVSKKITANHLTLISFISALLAVYFLFNQWHLLVIFTALHLTLDAVDGVVARISGENYSGKLLDSLSDNLPIFLLILKLGWYFNDVYAYLIAALFCLGYVIHLVSKFQSLFIPFRTAGLILMILFTFSIKPSLLTGSYLAAGIISVYTLARQLQYYLIK